MSKGWILRSHNGSSYYNGGRSSGWSYVSSPDDINSQYIYPSEGVIKALLEYDTKLKYWFEIVNLDGLVLKPSCTYERLRGRIPVIKKGTNNELCAICATNILADEEYVVWKDNKKYCLHCIMKNLSNIEELIGSVPSELKEEWAKYGKAKTKKCMENINNATI